MPISICNTRILMSLVATLALSAGLAAASTLIVGGTIATNEPWNEANGPYRVAGQCTVATGDTLTIGPGVDVLFDADVQLVVRGALHAVGTEADSIRFLASATNDSAEWGGIRISGDDSSTIAYARVNDGDADGSYPSYYGGGIYLGGFDDPRLGMYNCVISGNAAGSGGGLYIGRGTATLKR